jgi:hypothetical protein
MPSPGHGEQFTRRQEAAIAALLTCRTVKSAAQKAGVAEKTLHAWMQLPAFDAAYKAARKRVLAHAISLLQGASSLAVKTLVKNLRCGRPGPEIRAAIAILDKAIAAGQIEELAEEVAALKAKLGGTP